MTATALASLLVLAPQGAGAPKGLVLEQKTVHAVRSLVGMVNQEETIRVHLAPEGVRIDTVGSRYFTIFRVEKDGRVVRIEVNGRNRTFKRQDLAARRAEDEELREAARRMQERLAGGGAAGDEPASPLDALVGIMGGGGLAEPPEEDAPVEVRKLGDARTIAGRPCRGVEFLQRGEVVLEAWYTEAPAPDWIRRFDIEECPGGRNEALLAARRAERGLELESTLHLGVRGRYEVRTVKVTEGPVQPRLLQPPAGHRELGPSARPPKGSGER